MMFTTYILYSEKHNQIYVGYSSDHLKRLTWHNELSTKGHTLKYRPWVIIYTENYETKAEAMKREKELKSARGRRWIREELLGQ